MDKKLNSRSNALMVLTKNKVILIPTLKERNVKTQPVYLSEEDQLMKM